MLSNHRTLRNSVFCILELSSRLCRLGRDGTRKLCLLFHGLSTDFLTIIEYTNTFQP